MNICMAYFGTLGLGSHFHDPVATTYSSFLQLAEEAEGHDPEVNGQRWNELAEYL